MNCKTRADGHKFQGDGFGVSVRKVVLLWTVLFDEVAKPPMTKCIWVQAVTGSVSFKYMPYLLFSSKQDSEVGTLITPVLLKSSTEA